MGKIRIIISASNDLATDQRLKRHCGTLHAEGYEILLTGRILPGSLPLDDRPYKTKRIRHFFNRGPLFYAELNLRLFFFLLFRSSDVLNANDLDTLPACYLASLVKRVHLVYDSHEYFTEVPELVNRPGVRKIWKTIERSIFPRLKHIITVNRSIASAYSSEYSKHVHVIRNLPERKEIEAASPLENYGIPEGKRLIILQGSGINAERGADEAVDSMKHINGAILLIAGGGDAVPGLKKKVEVEGLQEKVIFIPLMPHDKLMQLTSKCDVGLSLDKDTALNYRYSLPNKLFDYISAGIPVVASPLPEVRSIVEGYGTGLIIRSHTPEDIAEKINTILKTMPKITWSANLSKAAEELNWDNERHKLVDIYHKIAEPQQ